MVYAYLLVHREAADSALKGEGAQLYGGRWSNKGVPLIYLADSLSLAMAELLAHLESHHALQSYCYRVVCFHNHQTIALNQRLLPDNWRDYPAPTATRVIGDTWFQSQDSLLLRVPSVMVPGEYNYLLNPEHRDFEYLNVGDIRYLDTN